MGGAPYMLTKQGGGHSLGVSMFIYKGVPCLWFALVHPVTLVYWYEMGGATMGNAPTPS